ncbi:MAG: type II toxin-antitoxin system HicA family toxin [Ignavibacteria bacterium]
MKRRDVVAHLIANGCSLLREGGRHSIWVNSAGTRTSAVPRHREIDDNLVRKICVDLKIAHPWQR